MHYSLLRTSRTKDPLKGFTLIELLVVIAIIGILSSVILASLGQARDKGNDAAAKTNLHTVQTQAEIFFSDHASKYNTDGTTAVVAGTACPVSGNTMFGTDVTVRGAIAAAKANGGGTALCYMSALGTAYAVQVQTKSGYWCIDNNGVASSSSSAMTSSWVKCQ